MKLHKNKTCNNLPGVQYRDDKGYLIAQDEYSFVHKKLFLTRLTPRYYGVEGLWPWLLERRA